MERGVAGGVSFMGSSVESDITLISFLSPLKIFLTAIRLYPWFTGAQSAGQPRLLKCTLALSGPASKDSRMTMKRPLQRFALAAVLIAVSGHGFAQFGGGGGGMGGGRRGARSDNASSQRTGDGLSTPATAAAKVRDKLYDLRLQLMVTPEQSPLWDRFSDAVWDLAGRGGLASAASADDQTAVQFAQQRATLAADRARRAQAVSDALSSLYDTLSPEQRHIADQNLPAVIP